MRAHSFASILVVTCALSSALADEHSHPIPEKLGRVVFGTSCSPRIGPAFNRGVALLHSFAYSAAEQQFREVADADPRCAMAHWGFALSYYHQLWAPPDAERLRRGTQEIDAVRHAPMSPRGPGLLFVGAAVDSVADRQDTCQSEARCPNPRTVVSRVSRTSGTRSLFDTRLRQFGTCVPRARGRTCLFTYRACRAARASHAVAHLHTFGTVGRLSRL
jgi:hypothetical protein